MKILIVDDHPIYAEGLKNLLASYDLEVVGIAGSGPESIDKAGECKPDVILMDVNMPLGSGIDATRQIATRYPGIRIIMLTSIDSDQALLESIKAGASGYLLKNLTGQDLKDSLEDLVAGKMPFAAGKQETLLDELKNHLDARSAPKTSASSARLTPRQVKITEYIAAGLTYKEIGSKLYITERTVKYHIQKIKETLQLENHNQLIAYCSKNRLY